ncbi:MAG: septal ring lytic transglycosylase RlpA family protein, partial [Steroidobacteraceae bacterium]
MRIGAAASLLLLAACAHTPHRPPATQPATPPSPTTVLPHNPPDVSQIPDAVPRPEPRSAFGNPPFYYVGGRRYAVLPSSTGYVERGVASWYGTEFHGLRTSTGEPYDMFAMTAAHKTLPLPCYARVTNLANGRSVVVRINDRGPFVANRIVDLSYSAASRLDMIRNGTAFVQLEVLTPASTAPNASMPVTTLSTEAARVGVSSVPAVSPAPAPPPPPEAPATIEAPTAPAPAAGVAPSPVGAFYIQVGAYSKAENADSAVRKLRAAGFDHAFTLTGSAHQPLLRVRIGPI